jgi:hypothetical protein
MYNTTCNRIIFQGGAIMAYNIIDLIDKALTITTKRKAIYESIGKNCGIPSITILSKVLVKDLDKTLQYYETLRTEVGNEVFEEIDVGTYDKISFLTNEFAKKLYVPDIKNTGEFFNFYLNLEKDLYSLLIDIQGRFVKNTSDVHTKTYGILSDMLKTKANHIKNIEKSLK